MIRIAKAIRPTSRRSGVRLGRRAGRCGPRGPPGRRVVRSAAAERLLGRRLLLEEVEIDVGVVALSHERIAGKIRPTLPLVGRARATGVFVRRAKTRCRGRSGACALSERARSSGAIGPCARSGAAAPARSGSRATSRRGSKSRSRSSLARARPRRAPNERRSQPPACGTSAACAPTALERDARNVYIAYEYVPGQTLRQALRAGELNDAAAVEAASADPGSARARARTRDRPPRRQAVERAGRRGRALRCGCSTSGSHSWPRRRR